MAQDDNLKVLKHRNHHPMLSILRFYFVKENEFI